MGSPINTETKYLTNAIGASKSLIIKKISQENQVLLICDTTEEINQFYLELSYLLKESQIQISTFPDWEILPYDYFSPQPNIISSRLKLLYQLAHNTTSPSIVITTSKTLIQRLAHKNFILAKTFIFHLKDRLTIEGLKKQLSIAGYTYVSQVISHGEFTIKGSIIDLFPMGAKEPVRLDLYDDVIDSIRHFNPETQTTTKEINSFSILPTHEFPLDATGIKIFNQNWKTYFNEQYQDSTTYRQLSQGHYTNNAECYLPLFFDQTQTLFDYLPDNMTLIYGNQLEKTIDSFWLEIMQRYEQLKHNIDRPLLKPKDIYLLKADFFSKLKQYKKISFNPDKQKKYIKHLPYTSVPRFNNSVKHKNNFAELKTFMEKFNKKIIFSVTTKGRREIIINLLKQENIHPKQYNSFSQCLESNEKISLCLAPFTEGVIRNGDWALLTEEQLLGPHAPQVQDKTDHKTLEQTINHLVELTVDDYIVHIEHGIAQYKGLKTFNRCEIESEFLILDYADHDILYVPVTNLELISRYTGINDENIKKSKLGSNQWIKDKEKAEKQVTDVAAELFNLYARRAARTGQTINYNKENYLLFKNGFPFEETFDQEKAIKAVLEDLNKTKPMDRLICGDVGFGKTEVALRASFVVVDNNKQVAILAPTTLLAEQHYETFINRFADWPFQIDILSRFTTPIRQKEIIQKVNSGKTDIIIGTHKLLNAAIKFKNLGLLVIDEEHRFGVKQKEKMKSLRSDVDILTLTATPIPRTLSLAVNQLRDISLITTPPKKRLSIKTFIKSQDDASIINDALNREFLRGGQAYYLHNNVKTISTKAEELSRRLPHARIATIHGQMPNKDIENIMRDFYRQKYNLLVCTTIIETGLDVTTCNTIIIERADKFGLAQLHQLRGRVGRSHHQAYAFLLIPPEQSITNNAKKRLEAISQLEELGSGFILATHDLEIRGMGEILGENQSGNIQAVGFSLYNQLLHNAVLAIKSGKELPTSNEINLTTEVNLHVSALIPENYMPDLNLRLTFYKRLALAENMDNLNTIQIELIDRFGQLPSSLEALFITYKIKLASKKLSIKKIDATNTTCLLEFNTNNTLNPQKVINLIQQEPAKFKLNGPTSIKFFAKMDTITLKYNQIINTLKRLN